MINGMGLENENTYKVENEREFPLKGNFPFKLSLEVFLGMMRKQRTVYGRKHFTRAWLLTLNVSAVARQVMIIILVTSTYVLLFDMFCYY